MDAISAMRQETVHQRSLVKGQPQLKQTSLALSGVAAHLIMDSNMDRLSLGLGSQITSNNNITPFTPLHLVHQSPNTAMYRVDRFTGVKLFTKPPISLEGATSSLRHEERISRHLSTSSKRHVLQVVVGHSKVVDGITI